MKVKEVIKKIEKDGWFIVRTKGVAIVNSNIKLKGLVTIAGKPSAELAA